MELELKTEYWHDSQAREAFKTFILNIHGLDFTEWEAQGYWDQVYTPFSYFKDGKIISSVCIYLLDAVIAGRSTRLIQISGVGTHPDWRRQGLSRELTELGLEWARGQHEGVFLFADTPAIPYYQACGFTPLKEYLEVIYGIPTETRPGAIQLDPMLKDQQDKIFEYAQGRVPLSDRFSINNPKLFMFYILYFLKNNIYEIKELGCLVCYKREGNTLSIYDIVAEEIPSFEDLYPYIAVETDHKIKFHFHTDKLGLRNVERERIEHNHAFTRGNFPVNDPVFPYTSRA
ncbi:MAG: GNAT family N-acetyltransferase [Candidatus Marinimicrobia bacterium]|nr:GNAT family N-acetyltransferase [Candidatus Neomarinimicrobiota bacterium]